MNKFKYFQAAIVRIMKEKKNQNYSLLIQETIQKLSSVFKPNVSSIKVKFIY